MRLWDRLLASVIARFSQRLYNSIQQWVGIGQVEEAQNSLEQGYRTAHVTGVRWSLLDLLGFRERIEATPEALESLARARGLEVEITHPQVVNRLNTQIAIAKSRFIEGLEIPGTSARAAGFAVRWGVQQGISDVGEYSTVVNSDGIATDMLKQWVRLVARAEKRQWHDALNGVTIPYNEKFRLVSPRGIYLIDRPYDPALPIGEKVNCGHGIRLLLPKDASEFSLWRGQAKSPASESGNSPPAIPRFSPYRPSGLAFDENVNIPEGPQAARTEHAVRQIARVHGAGEMPPIGVRFVSKIEGGLAEYAYDNTSQAAGVIKLLNSGKGDILDTVHEFGHSLDHQVFGQNGLLGSLRRDSPLRELLDLAEQTPTIKRYRGALENGRIFLGQESRPLTGVRRLEVENLLEPQEVFARVYSQYIAITSGDPEMLQIVGNKRLGAANIWYPSYLNEDEFEALAVELERLLRINRLTR